jgi:methylated-DNA-[protein]-cysteine S-methyltransferase
MTQLPTDPDDLMKQMSQDTRFVELTTPIGALVVTSDGDAVTGVYMEAYRHGPLDRSAWTRDDGSCAALVLAAAQLQEYFAGNRVTFDVPIRVEGSPLQTSVWSALSRIPYGETRSYGEIAVEICNPKAVRAVGAANGRNPVSIIVPCHRVIGANGSLTGFGGGVERKEWLLAHEARVRGTERSFRAPELFPGH